MARTDPALAGEGAVLLLEKLSPAVNQIDSSSCALGNATNGVVEMTVPLIAAAPVPRRVREKWLERLFCNHAAKPAQSIPMSSGFFRADNLLPLQVTTRMGKQPKGQQCQKEGNDYARSRNKGTQRSWFILYPKSRT